VDRTDAEATRVTRAGQQPWLAILLPTALKSVRWRWVVSVTVTGAAIIALIVFLLPATYESTSTIVPVRESQSSMAAGLAGLGAAVGFELTSPDNPAQVYPEILRSRTLIEAVLTKPLAHPVTRESTTYLAELRIREARPDRRLFIAVERFRRHLRISLDAKSSVVRVTLEGRTSWLVAAALNALVAELQSYAVSMRSEVAQQNRLFAEREQAEVRNRLAEAERMLTAFRERNLRIGNSPQLLLEQERLIRNVKTEEEIFLTLVRESELAKLAEEKTTPMVSVLDLARPAPFKARPRRLLLLLVGTAAVFLAAVGISAWLDAPRPQHPTTG
jgi:uncharacterized protein involved in exopolysaccharide biosynthesis